MFDSTQPAQQARPTTRVAGPVKSAERPTTRHSVIGQITGFLFVTKFRVFIGQLRYKIHWVLQAWATNTILYDCIPVIILLCSKRNQRRHATVVWL